MTGILLFSNFLPSLPISLCFVDIGMILSFVELSSILDPGRPPKMDKVIILGDAARMVSQLRGETQKLKELEENLLEKINELKVCFDFVVPVFLFHFRKYMENQPFCLESLYTCECYQVCSRKMGKHIFNFFFFFHV